ncbi:retrotransposon protein, putative, ty1-copia subclass [Tanacetum coccineum]|uniref:Retrotransposon protein, putative, ty1-copia subclass n=1 Tax=Tanacetum coccineum TaxID=301880 RepID=A0ABQ5B703_9ASTR
MGSSHNLLLPTRHNIMVYRKGENQTLLDMVQTMISLTTLPMSFWGYALESTAHILNMVPTKKGCEALVKRDMSNKLESRSIKCIFVGYPKETMGYYFYYPLENKIFVARYAEFFETSLIKQKASGSTIDFDEIQRENAQPSENTSLHQHEVEHDVVDPQTDVIPVRRSVKIPQAPERYGFYIDAEEHELGDHGEPPNYRSALSDLEFEKWLEAMNTEMQSMKDNQVWNLVIFLQTVDYEETFSPVADIKAIRILIAIEAYYDYEIWQMDVKTAFLNGLLNEDIYMVQPEEFVNPKHPRRMDTSKRGTIPMQPNVDLRKSQGPSTPAKDDLRSQTGYVFVMNRGAVDWKSSKKSTTTMSSMEAEYIAVAEAAMEAIWIRKFISGLGVIPSIDKPMDMYCYNTCVITIADKPGVQNGAKHFRRKYHFIREAIQEGDIHILKVHIDNN